VENDTLLLTVKDRVHVVMFDNVKQLNVSDVLVDPASIVTFSNHIYLQKVKFLNSTT